MSKEHTYCVIMAGGIGSRFWPISRAQHPKQFLDILGTGRSLLQQTYDRFLNVCPAENILIVTNDRYKQQVQQQLPDMAEDQIILEPSRRNTAPCIAYANYRILKHDPEACIIVAPSDHLVMKEREFEQIIDIAVKQARSADQLVTLGIMPSRPDTGYGYIQFETDQNTTHPKVKKVKTFTEKPDHETALSFIESGDFLWNSGIFIWTLDSIMSSFKQHLPEIDALFEAGKAHFGTPEEEGFIAGTYGECANISIDYGIMEKADNVFVVVSEFGWSDLGTWGSLYTHLPHDTAGNAIVGEHVKTYDCERNMVHTGEDGRLVVLQGLEEHIVVSTKDVLLICKKQDEQKIRQFVNDMKADSGDKFV